MSDRNHNEYKQLALDALRLQLGIAQDNYNRARTAYTAYAPEQLDAPYGQSDRTARQILAEYEDDVARLQEAIEWLGRVPAGEVGK